MFSISKNKGAHSGQLGNSNSGNSSSLFLSLKSRLSKPFPRQLSSLTTTTTTTTRFNNTTTISSSLSFIPSYTSSSRAPKSNERMTVTIPVYNLLHVRFDECLIDNDKYANMHKVIRNITENVRNRESFKKIMGSSVDRLMHEIRKLFHSDESGDYITWDDFRQVIETRTMLDLPISTAEPIVLQSYSITSPRYDEERRNYQEFLKNYDGNGDLLNIVKRSPEIITLPASMQSRLRDPLVHDRIDQLIREKDEAPEEIEDTRMRSMSEDEAEEMNDNSFDPTALIAARYAPLSTEEAKRVASVLRLPEGNNEVRPMKFDIPIINSTILRLRPGIWLNDEIVNFCMSMLQERDMELVSRNPSRTPSFFFNSYFISKLLDEGGYKYSNVKRWSTRFKINIFELSKVFFPVNISNNHWTMAMVDMKKKQVCYYDSFHAKGDKYLNGLMNYVVDEGLAKHNIVVDRSEWTFISANNSSPMQTNGCDCGVFSIMCADFLSDDLPLSYHQSEMNTFRSKICADILRGSFTYPFN